MFKVLLNKWKQKKTILVVEDDKSLLPMITYNIEKNGFKVRSATNGEDALLMIKEEIPSLAIFDWMIPEPSGLELCKIVRRKPETSNLPIIMLTAKEEEEDRVKGLNMGLMTISQNHLVLQNLLPE